MTTLFFCYFFYSTYGLAIEIKDIKMCVCVCVSYFIYDSCKLLFKKQLFWLSKMRKKEVV